MEQPSYSQEETPLGTSPRNISPAALEPPYEPVASQSQTHHGLDRSLTSSEGDHDGHSKTSVPGHNDSDGATMSNGLPWTLRSGAAGYNSSGVVENNRENEDEREILPHQPIDEEEENAKQQERDFYVIAASSNRQHEECLLLLSLLEDLLLKESEEHQKDILELSANVAKLQFALTCFRNRSEHAQRYLEPLSHRLFVTMVAKSLRTCYTIYDEGGYLLRKNYMGPILAARSEREWDGSSQPRTTWQRQHHSYMGLNDVLTETQWNTLVLMNSRANTELHDPSLVKDENDKPVVYVSEDFCQTIAPQLQPHEQLEKTQELIKSIANRVNRSVALQLTVVPLYRNI